MKRALLFSGQGSQYVGMLSDWYEHSEKARYLVEKANDILGYDIKSIMFDGPADKLKETRYTQPAIFLHSVIAFEHIDNMKFSAVSGHSVGEYAALYGAGVISFEDGLELVSLRGNLMFNAGEENPGTMFAVIGMDDLKVEEVCNDFNNKEKGNIVVAANFNSPGQIVISGSRDYLREVAPKFKEWGAKLVKELQVSGAFHSPLMLPAKEKLSEKINKINFNDAKADVYCNVTAQPERLSENLKSNLIEQLSSPVRWTQTLSNLDKNNFDTFTELGPGKVLQGLTKRTLNDVKIEGVDKLTDLENI